MNPNLLLVEDDPVLREGLTELLLHEQYAVTAVACFNFNFRCIYKHKMYSVLK